jgi:hypothetical protein
VVMSNLEVLDRCRRRGRDVDASAQLHRVVNVREASSVYSSKLTHILNKTHPQLSRLHCATVAERKES